MTGQTYNLPPCGIRAAAQDSGIIKLGDTITYRGGWGSKPPAQAKVDSLTITDEPRAKYGTPVRQVSEWSVRGNWVVFGLDNGRWCYSDQVDLPGGES